MGRSATALAPHSGGGWGCAGHAGRACTTPKLLRRSGRYCDRGRAVGGGGVREVIKHSKNDRLSHAAAVPHAARTRNTYHPAVAQLDYFITSRLYLARAARPTALSSDHGSALPRGPRPPVDPRFRQRLQQAPRAREPPAARAGGARAGLGRALVRGRALKRLLL
jgi:hypothetical protein